MKIIYGISAEGMGHAVRSRPIIDELLKTHEVIVFSEGNAFNYLKTHFKNTREITTLKLVYKYNKVKNFRSVLFNLLKIHKIINSIFKIHKEFKSFNPDIVICDFEILTHYVALFAKKPILAIDNENLITKAFVPTKNFLTFLKAYSVIRLISPKANNYLIPSFFDLQLKKNAVLTPPILREEFSKRINSKNSFVLVYQTSNTNTKLLDVIKRCSNHKFIIYGFNKDDVVDNLRFKLFNEKRFIYDLKHCKALINNGSFTSTSEALSLGKPVLAIPIKGQYEQYINSYYLEKLDYGSKLESASFESINTFLNNLEKYKKINSVNWNKQFFKELHKSINILCQKKQF